MKSKVNGMTATVLFSVASAVLAVGITWGVKSSAITQQGECIKTLEVKQQTDHDLIIELRSDVKHIRQTVDRLATEK